jgi:hypothetical protein
MIAFLGQDPVRCKIIADDKCYNKYRILNACVVIFPMKMGKTVKKT